MASKISVIEEDELDGILISLEPEYIPSEFIVAAHVISLDGDEYMITVEEFNEMHDIDGNLEDTLEENGILEVSLILDTKKIKKTIRKYSKKLLRAIPV